MAETRSKSSDLMRIREELTNARLAEQDRQFQQLDKALQEVGSIPTKQTNRKFFLKAVEVSSEKHEFSSEPVSKQRRNSDITQLKKEWLAFQKVEHERQLRELDRRMHDGPTRENKQERKLREVTIFLSP